MHDPDLGLRLDLEFGQDLTNAGFGSKASGFKDPKALTSVRNYDPCGI
jgi:hypothetical protein